MELYRVPAGSLDAWIAEHLQPSEEFRLQVKDTVRRICDFLKETCFDDIKVFKTVKASATYCVGDWAPPRAPAGSAQGCSTYL
ncbi:2'-5'-oligoadenylate synthase 3 [Chelonia mydas]|uniref:2'-5'-oligoadenylate synthase 3 n=1 Tax=Chelonia mydas TaxID=8469 RepID=M7B7F3_CHEMY|nr:2'-5'-oligoadenylate synthase 3 [Chelonia mydas]